MTKADIFGGSRTMKLGVPFLLDPELLLPYERGYLSVLLA
jgi:hypothetical protein